MKMASYFLISVAFHAAVLAFPFSAFETGREQVFPVVLLVQTREMPAQTPAGNSAVQRGKKKTEKSSYRKPHIEKPAETIIEPTEPDREKPVEEAVSRKDLFPPLMEKIVESRPPAEEVARLDVNKMTASAPPAVQENEKSREQPEEQTFLQAEVSFEDKREGMRATEVSFARAGYDYNPRPHYPEKARREGWEGEVLLRVLVDREGRPESVEVSRSSGFATLDRAALESVKSWRFHPARYGDQQVESWVKIPIVFRLADLKK